jgi:hypothetical protein
MEATPTMSDLSPDTSQSHRSKRHRPITIELPNGQTLEQRAHFADGLGVTDKTVKRLNAPTTYIGNVAYVDRGAALEVLAARIKHRNQPARRRGAR